MEQDTRTEDELEQALEYWAEQFSILGIENSSVAQSYSEIEHHKFLRHWVPEHVIALSKSYQQSLQVTDYSVPSSRFREMFEFCIEKGKLFEEKQDSQRLGYVFFAHAGDSHVHLTLLPNNDKEAEFGNSLLITIMRKAIELGGTIAAEHGLGKKQFEGKPAICLQYGSDGLSDIKKMKEIIDPNLLINRENLIGV